MDSDAKEVVAAGGMLGYSYDEQYQANEPRVLFILAAVLLAGFIIPTYGFLRSGWSFESVEELTARGPGAMVGSGSWIMAAAPLALAAMLVASAWLRKRGAALVATAAAATALCVFAIKAGEHRALGPLKLSEGWEEGFDAFAGDLALMRCVAVAAVWPALWVNIRGKGREMFRIVALLAATGVLVSTGFLALMMATGHAGLATRYSLRRGAGIWEGAYMAAGWLGLAAIAAAGVASIMFCWAPVPRRLVSRLALAMLGLAGLFWFTQLAILAHVESGPRWPELAELAELGRSLCVLGGAAAIVPVTLTHFAARGR